MWFAFVYLTELNYRKLTLKNTPFLHWRYLEKQLIVTKSQWLVCYKIISPRVHKSSIVGTCMKRKSMFCSSFVYHAYLHFNCAISFCKATSDDAFLMRMAFSALRVCTSLSSDVTRCRIPWSVSAWASQHSEAEPPSGFCGRTGTNTCTIAATRRSPAIIVKNSHIHSFGSYLCYHINAILEGVIYTHWHCFDSYTTWQSYPID